MVNPLIALSTGATLVVTIACGGSQAEVVVPERPASVSASAVWAGGIDGGAWIDCRWTVKEPVQQYDCTIYDDQIGSIWSVGEFVLACRETPGDPFSPCNRWFKELKPTYYNGVFIGLQDGTFLVPHGVIDHPFPDGGGKRGTYNMGKEIGDEVEYQ